MLTPAERKEVRAVLKLLDTAYDALAKLGRIQGQEPSGWQSDDPTSDVRYWEGPPKRET
jgi:hypothetical protein